MVSPEKIESFFHPRSIAIVGVSDRMANAGKMFYHSQKGQGFSGPVYAVNPNRDVKDIPTFRRLVDIPGPVDYVIVCVPSQHVPGVIEDAVAKGVRCATVFSSGFSETGTQEGTALQERIAETARRGGLHIIGPNCMGIHCPASGLSFRPDMPTSSGPAGLASQSGGIAISSALMAAARGVPFGKIISFGNESDLSAPDIIRYYAQDPETEVIVLYAEGTRDGRALAGALIEAGRKKPLIALKGGRSAEGGRAVSSHTGALAGDMAAWDAVFRQANAVVVPDLDEMIDAVEAYQRLDMPRGRNLAVLTISGGFGVVGTDLVAEHGFRLPAFSDKAARAIGEHIHLPGTSCRNPLDMAANIFWLGDHSPLFRSINDDGNIDALLVLLSIEYVVFDEANMGGFTKWFLSAFLAGLKSFERPAAFVLFHSIMPESRLQIESRIREAGYPVFPTVQRALSALAGRMRSRAAEKAVGGQD